MEKMLAWKELRPYMNSVGIDIAHLPERVIGEECLTEHPAIIITGICPERLERLEMQVYTLIIGRMLEAFMPSCRMEYTTVEAVCAARKFGMLSCRILEKGWHAIFEREGDAVPQGCTHLALPEIQAGETLSVAACNLVHKKDLPASPFTDAELIEYMDTAGLGTVATRSNIIQTLINRKYIRYSRHHIIPTRKGLYIYETVRGMKIANAALTSGWEARLARMERGKLLLEVFLADAKRLSKEVTDEIFRTYKPKG